MQTINQLRDYGRFLGIRGLWRKNKKQLEEHLFNSVFNAVNERMVRKPDMDPARAYMEAELSLRAKKLTQQKTWREIREKAQELNVPVKRNSTKEGVEHKINQRRGNQILGKHRKARFRKSFLEEFKDLVAHIDHEEDGKRVKRFKLTGNLNNISTRLVMDTITPHISMRTWVVYSFEAEIYQKDGEIVSYKKTLETPGLFTSLSEIKDYIEECEQKRLDLDNDEVWSKAYMPKERTIDTKGNYMGKVIFLHVQVKLIASDEPLIGCGPLPEWLAGKRCIYSVDKFMDNLCIWRCLAIFFRKKQGRTNQVEKRLCSEALSLARDYYNDKKLVKEAVRATKLVDFEGISKFYKLNIMLYEPKGVQGKDREIWRLVYGKIQYKKDLPTVQIGLLDGHCFYIKDLNVLCKKWECKACKQIFTYSENLTRHLKEDRCTGGKTKMVCKGKKFRRILNSSEKVFNGGDTKFSFAACQWIEAESVKLKKHIHHKFCGHGGERNVTVWIEDNEGKKKRLYISRGWI